MTCRQTVVLPEPTWRRFGCRVVGLDVRGRSDAPDGGVGVRVEDRGLAGGLAVEDDLERTVGRRCGIVAQDDGAADEDGVGFVEASVEADGAVLHDAALDLEQEHVVEVGTGIGVADVGAGGGPPVQGRLAVEAPVRGLVVLAFDPGPEAADVAGGSWPTRCWNVGTRFTTGLAYP